MHDTQDEFEPPSKSQRKRDMKDLQALGDRLVKLSNENLRTLNLPERLYDAVREAKRLTAWGAISRQSQFIGKLMRDIDPTPIQALLDRLQGKSDEHSAWLHLLERTRERLLSDDKALQDLLSKHPEADAQYLRTLIRNARKERDEQKPPKHFRVLFQSLKELMPEPELPGQAKADSEDNDDDE